MALRNAVDALDFKMQQVLAREENRGVEGTKRMVDAVLGILARAGDAGAGRPGQVRTDDNAPWRIGWVCGWKRYGHALAMRETKKEIGANLRRTRRLAVPAQPAAGPAPPLERQLLELLLADPDRFPKRHGRYNRTN